MQNWQKATISIITCELVGILSTPFTVSAISSWYAYLNKPAFSPPNWIFAPVWTLLYLLMGISLYLIWKQGWHKKSVKTAIKLFLVHLVFNFMWSILFFGLRSPLLGLLDILVLLMLIVWSIKKFYPLSKLSAYLLIPYLAWVSFATALNAAIFLLN